MCSASFGILRVISSFLIGPQIFKELRTLVNSHSSRSWEWRSSRKAASSSHTAGTASREARAASRAPSACPAPSAAPTLCRHGNKTWLDTLFPLFILNEPSKCSQTLQHECLCWFLRSLMQTNPANVLC